MATCRWSTWQEIIASEFRDDIRQRLSRASQTEASVDQVDLAEVGVVKLALLFPGRCVAAVLKQGGCHDNGAGQDQAAMGCLNLGAEPGRAADADDPCSRSVSVAAVRAIGADLERSPVRRPPRPRP